MHHSHIKLADTINHFKFHPDDMSPPAHTMTQESMAVRNLTIIDMTNRLAKVLEETCKTKFNKDEWLQRALSSR